MILVIFEVTMKKDRMDDYLAIAAKLKDNLVKAKGFVGAERFSSLVSERKLLSLSVWEDEEAVTAWRNQHEHRMGQQQGHNELFESYTITVASSLRSYTDQERQEAPKDSGVLFNR